MTNPDYYALLTTLGEQTQAEAIINNTQWAATHMCVGSGTGDGAQGTPTPNKHQTALVQEQASIALNTLYQSPHNPGQIVAEMHLPPEIGGWWIRELGLKNAAGDLLAVANCPPTFKPQLESGSGRMQVLRMVFKVTDPESLTLIIDPAVVLATQEDLNQGLAAEILARQQADQQLHNSKLDKTDPAVTNARDWTAGIVSKTEAEAGTANTARKWTAARVKQAIDAWWNGSTAKTKLDGIATNATANATDAQLRARSSHTGTQAISTVAGLQTALDSKAASSHTHAIASVTGLQPALDGKAASSHTHTLEQVSGIPQGWLNKIKQTLSIQGNQYTGAAAANGVIFTAGSSTGGWLNLTLKSLGGTASGSAPTFIIEFRRLNDVSTVTTVKSYTATMGAPTTNWLIYVPPNTTAFFRVDSLIMPSGAAIVIEKAERYPLN